jgi:hypothetical protein
MLSKLNLNWVSGLRTYSALSEPDFSESQPRSLVICTLKAQQAHASSFAPLLGPAPPF